MFIHCGRFTISFEYTLSIGSTLIPVQSLFFSKNRLLFIETPSCAPTSTKKPFLNHLKTFVSKNSS